jgi:hypothetical protein
MAVASPVDLDTARLRAEIQEIDGRVASEPSGDFHFHRGPAYGEVFRILKPEGQFLYADIAVANELSESIRRDIDLWTG